MKKKAYAVYYELDRVLAFFYDNLIMHRSEGGAYIFEPVEKAGWRVYANSIEKVTFAKSFAAYDGVESTMKWFMDCTNLSEIVGIQNLRTDNVVNMSGMFWNCSSLVCLDLSSFNTVKVHSMGWMFSGCSSLSKLDVSSFDTKNVTFMGDMFSFCSSLKELDLSNFNTERVEYMSGMFEGDVLLKDLNVSNFNVENVKSLNEMFTNCPLPKGVDWITPVGLENLPTRHPHYPQKNAVDVYDLKKVIYSYCCGVREGGKPTFDENAIIPELLPVWRAFKKNGFDFYKLMQEKDYELIEDEELRVEVLMWLFPLLNLPIGKFATDWLNGYLDFFRRETDDITDTEVLRQLFFCTTEEDIWKLLASGIGNLTSLYHWYKGDYLNPILEDATGIPCHNEKDEKKAAEFLDYLLDESTNARDGVREEAMRLKSI